MGKCRKLLKDRERAGGDGNKKMSKECKKTLLPEGFLCVLPANSSFWKGEFFMVQTTAVETIRGDLPGQLCRMQHNRLSLKITKTF